MPNRVPVLTRTLGALLMGLTLVTGASASSYPDKAVRLVVGFPPGGTADQVARIAAQKLAEIWGQPVVVDNRGGAAGNIAASQVAKATADGYTLMVGFDGTMVINPSVYAKVPFDSQRDFVAITRIADAPVALAAHPGFAPRSCADMVAYARANPGKLSFASVGSGSTGHLAAEMMIDQAKLKMTHVPYRGGGPATVDVMAGQVPLMFATLGTVSQQVRVGKLKLLAVSSGQRNSSFPDVPTIAECGFPGFDVASWFGLFAPAGTPEAIVERLHASVVEMLAAPDTRERLQAIGAVGVGNTSAAFTEQVRTETARWGALVRAVGVQPD